MSGDPRDDKLVTVFASRSHLATVEAQLIYSLLDSAGIPAWIVRENVVQQPVGKVSIKVTDDCAEDALQLIAEAGNAEFAEDVPELESS